MLRLQLCKLSYTGLGLLILLFSGCTDSTQLISNKSSEIEKDQSKISQNSVDFLEYSSPLLYEGYENGTIWTTDGTLLIKDNCLVIQHDVKFVGEKSRESALVFPENTLKIADGVLSHDIYQKIGEGYRFGGFNSTINDERIKPNFKCQFDTVWFVR